MTSTIRAAYPSWPYLNRQLRDVVASLDAHALAIRPAPDRWPLWATIGHLACQRVSWLCGFAGEPGAERTPFPDALHRCPGDEYLEPAMDAAELAGSLDLTFGIVEACLDRWMPGMLDEEIRRRFGERESVHTRGWVIGRVYAHDAYHVAEINEILVRAGLRQVAPWD